MELTRFREFTDVNGSTYLIDVKKVCAIIRDENYIRINLISCEEIFFKPNSQSEAIELYDALAIWWKYWSQEGDKKQQV